MEDGTEAAPPERPGLTPAGLPTRVPRQNVDEQELLEAFAKSWQASEPGPAFSAAPAAPAASTWQAYEAESRANLLRIVAIGAFYLVHLWSYFSAQGKVPNCGFFQLEGFEVSMIRGSILVGRLVLCSISRTSSRAQSSRTSPKNCPPERSAIHGSLLVSPT